MAPGSTRYARLALAAGLLAAAGLISACAQTPGYPSLPVGDVIGQQTLTPAQQEAEIKDLSEAQAENTAEAEPAPDAPQYIPASVDPTE